MKMKVILLTLMALATILMVATPVFAIADPSSVPYLDDVQAWRNCLETADFFIMFKENTPYTTTPSVLYSEAFIWRLYDSDNVTELAQASTSDYNEDGYGYNVVGFYFAAADVPDSYWEKEFVIKLTGVPTHFEEVPTYSFVMSASDYSSLTDTDDVKADIAETVLEYAADLNNRWGLTADYWLLEEYETATKLSLYGQTFFRQAIYGIQGLAPAAFSFSINNIPVEDRTWTDAYSDNLTDQHSGTLISTGTAAGNRLLDVSYNMFGMLLTLFLCAVMVLAHWRIAGGNLWRSLLDAAIIMVIGARLSLMGLGEVGLIASLAWLFISAKMWKVI